MFKLTGTVKVINPTQQVSEKFMKREFVVTDSSGMYPQDIMFQSTQDKCSLLDSVQINDTVEVSFNLRGREWVSPQGETRYFNTLEAWRIEKMGGANTGGGFGAPAEPMGMPSAPSAPNFGGGSSEEDDLPF
mgnify:CR=1 FL=1